MKHKNKVLAADHVGGVFLFDFENNRLVVEFLVDIELSFKLQSNKYRLKTSI